MADDKTQLDKEVARETEGNVTGLAPRSGAPTKQKPGAQDNMAKGRKGG